jgi:hypothetical protein
VIAALVFAVAQSDAARVGAARVEITGPCSGISAQLSGAGRLELTLDPALSAGERRTFELAVPLPAASLPLEVWKRALSHALEASEHAKLIELEPAAELDGVAPELLARPRVELAARGARVPWSALCVLGAALAITLTHRRRIWIATSIALLAGGSILALVRGLGAPTIPAARMLETRFDQPPGEPMLARESRRGRLELDDLRRGRIEVTPRQKEIRCRTQPAPVRFALEAPGATFVRSIAVDPATRRLSREVNAFASFEAAWLREPDGTWSYLGPWNLGQAIPPGQPGEPPGWLVPALPMGTSIFLGRLEDNPFPQAFAGADGPAVWLRGLGL